MTGLAKGLIISVAVVVVIIALGIGVGIYWVSVHGGEYVEKSKQSMTDGANFGKGTDNQGCVTETISRYKQDQGFSSAIATQLFFQGCLQASRETPGFCEAVPKRTEIMESVKWQTRQCSQYNLRDSYCGQIFGQVQTFCEMRQGRGEADKGKGGRGERVTR